MPEVDDVHIPFDNDILVVFLLQFESPADLCHLALNGDFIIICNILDHCCVLVDPPKVLPFVNMFNAAATVLFQSTPWC